MEQYDGKVASIGNLWLTDFGDTSASHHWGGREDFRYIVCVFPYSWNDEIRDSKTAMLDALRWGDNVTFTGRVAFYPGDHYQLSDCWVTPSAVTSLTKDDWLAPSVMKQYEGRVVSIRDLQLTEIDDRGAYYRYPEGNDFIYCRFPYPLSGFPFSQGTHASRYLSQATLRPGEIVTFTGTSHHGSEYRLSDCMATRLPPPRLAGTGGGG